MLTIVLFKLSLSVMQKNSSSNSDPISKDVVKSLLSQTESVNVYDLLYSKLVVCQQHKHANGMDLSL